MRRPLYNPPYRREIAYRIGDHRSFFDAMRALLHVQQVEDGPATNATPPLLFYYYDAPEQWITALLEVWAEVGDIITFYQERIANEGYLGTAVEPSSVEALFRSAGLPVPPNLAAAGHVAFTASTQAAGIDQFARLHPPGPATIPHRALLRSITDGDALPPVFETQGALSAHPSWNKIPAHVKTVVWEPPFQGETTQVLLDGTKTGVRPGQELLLQGEDPRAQAPTSFVRTILHVETKRKQKYTRVSWAEPLGDPAQQEALLENPEVTGFAGTAGLLGAKAQPWSSQSEATKRQYAPLQGGVLISSDGGETWTLRNEGLPLDSPVTVAFAGDVLLAGLSDKGIYGLEPGAAGFQARSKGIASARMLTLLDDGDLYAGTVGGGVYTSRDRGGTWQPLSGTHPTVNAKTGQTTYYKLPRTNVGALAISQGLVFAGTDLGIFRYTPATAKWDTTAVGAKGASVTSITPVANVSSPPGASRPSVEAQSVSLLAATTKGLYGYATPGGAELDDVVDASSSSGWTPFAHQLPAGRTPLSLLQHDGILYCGSDAGIFVLVGDTWLPWNGGGETALPKEPVAALTATSNAILAGTSGQGLYRSADGGFTWHRCDAVEAFSADAALASALDQGKVTAAVRYAFSAAGYGLRDPQVKTGAPKGGPWEIDDDARRYSLKRSGGAIAVHRLEATPSICSLAASTDDILALATPMAGFVATEWPGFQLHGADVDLDQTYDKIVAQSTVVLTETSGKKPVTTSATVKKASRIAAKAFGLDGPVTRLTLDDAGDLSAFGLRTARVSTQSQRLPLYRPTLTELTPVSGSSVHLAVQVRPPLPLPRRATVLGKPLRATLGLVGGVFSISSESGRRRSLPNRSVRALASLGGTLVVGTEDDGAFLLPSRASMAEPASQGLPAGPVQALIESGGSVFAGTRKGAFVLDKPGSWSAAGLRGKDVRALASSSGGSLLAGTATGEVFSSGPGRPPGWKTLPRLSAPVTALLARGDDVFAGTTEGVFEHSAGEWHALAGLPDRAVHALAVDAGGDLVAATTGGVFRRGRGSTTWSLLQGSGLGAHEVQCVATIDGTLYAGTAGRGMFAWSRADDAWKTVALGLSNDVRALARGGDGVVAGTEASSCLISADGQRTLTLKQNRVLSANVSDATLYQALDQGTVPDTLVSLFAASGTKLSDEATVAPAGGGGGAWLLADKSARYALVAAGTARSPALLAFLSDASLSIRHRPEAMSPTSKTRGTTRWVLEDDLGFQGSLEATSGELVLCPAKKADALVSEQVTIVAQSPTDTQAAAQTADDDTTTTVTLRTPLKGYFDASTTTLCANVARISQGQTTQEVIGSGDAAKAHQAFRVTAPVAFRAADDGSGAVESTLQVDVDGVAWTPVDVLARCGPSDRVYVAHYDAQGIATVTFGDGVRGARLPSGNRNVGARYVRGGGPSGEVPAGRISQLMTRPHMIRQVVNHSKAARPGSSTEPETPSASTAGAESSRRRSAPPSIRTLGRVVSKQDFTDFALGFTGIEKAVSRVLHHRERRIIHLTVGGDRGPPTEDVLHGLTRAIESARAPGLPFRVQRYRARYFRVAAKVAVRTADEEHTVVKRAASRLASAFGYAERDLAVGISASEVLSVLQAVDGVVGADLLAVYAAGDSPSLQPHLPGAVAAYCPQRDDVVAAGIWLLDPTRGGLHLEAEVA